MTARWHLGPITGAYFWWVLVTSPEILVFLFFMITDPRTTPRGQKARVVYAVSVGLLAALLIAPQRTEYATKVAVLGALAIVCAVRPLLGAPSGCRLPDAAGRLARRGTRSPRRRLRGRARRRADFPRGRRTCDGNALAAPLTDVGRLPQITILPSKGVENVLDQKTSRRIAADLLRTICGCRRSHCRIAGSGRSRARRSATSCAALTDVQVGRPPRDATITVPGYRLDRIRLRLTKGRARTGDRRRRRRGTMTLTALQPGPPKSCTATAPGRSRETLELQEDGGRWLVARVRSGRPVASAPVVHTVAKRFDGVRLTDVAGQVGLDFRQDDFRFGMSNDVHAMMGGGLCWLDYNNDGWLDLFVVNSYTDANIDVWNARGGPPRAHSSRTCTASS